VIFRSHVSLHGQRQPACYDCNPFSPGGDDVVTRSHESLPVNPLPVPKKGSLGLDLEISNG